MTATQSIIGKKFQVLDHGSVTLLDVMGSDLAIAEAAWVSTEGIPGKRSQVPQFLDYLMRHRHMSPFEMCEVKLRIKLPLFVQAQLATHRTASRNQISARYTELPSEVYVPEVWRGGTTGHNKQGSGEGVERQLAVTDWYASAINEADSTHTAFVTEGVAPELARIVQPVSQYTELVWKIDLRNLMGFLSLRTDSHAQWEIRQYAEVIQTIAEQLFPQAMHAWKNHVKYAVTFSREEQETLAGLIELGLDKAGAVTHKEIASEVRLRSSVARKSQQDELIAKLLRVLSAS